jgi:hypothetical protein
MTHPSPRALLATMEAARRQTRQHLGVVHRQVAGRAERLTVTHSRTGSAGIGARLDGA